MIALEQSDGTVEIVMLKDVMSIHTTVSSIGTGYVQSVTEISGVGLPSYREHRPDWFPPPQEALPAPTKEIER